VLRIASDLHHLLALPGQGDRDVRRHRRFAYAALAVHRHLEHDGRSSAEWYIVGWMVHLVAQRSFPAPIGIGRCSIACSRDILLPPRRWGGDARHVACEVKGHGNQYRNHGVGGAQRSLQGSAFEGRQGPHEGCRTLRGLCRVRRVRPLRKGEGRRRRLGCVRQKEQAQRGCRRGLHREGEEERGPRDPEAPGGEGLHRMDRHGERP